MLDRNGFYERYSGVDQNREVIELNLKGLPKEAEVTELKKIAGVRHVIDAKTDINNLTNECTGTGTLKFRLGDGETKEQVIERLNRVGVQAENPVKPGRLTNNYTDISYVSFIDPHVQVQSKGHITQDFVDSKTQKVRHLESNVIIGDNTSILSQGQQFEQKVRTDKRDLNEA